MSKNPDRLRGDYEVGKGRPPKHSRYKKGQSGNPGGKRKKPPTLGQMVDAVALSEIQVNRNGQPTTVMAMEGVLLSGLQQALKGNTRAIELFLRFAAEHGFKAKSAEIELEDGDDELLARALGRGTGEGGFTAAAQPDPTGDGGDDV